MSSAEPKARLPRAHSKLRLDDLDSLSRDQLVIMWERAYKCTPPKGVRRGLLQRSAAWHIQARCHPFLVDRVKTKLKDPINDARRVARGSGAEASGGLGIDGSNGVCARTSPPALGTRLVRQWNGRTYIVDVTAEGYMLDGSAYRSLTAIARRITGTHWSGPRFFGL